MEDLTVKALEAIGATYNRLDTAPLRPFLTNHTEWHSQDVFEVLRGADSILDYLTGKFETLSKYPRSDHPLLVLAELPSDGPCLAIFQDEGGGSSYQTPVALILVKHDDEALTSISMCSIAPHPSQARLSRNYPGLTPEEGSKRMEAFLPGNDLKA